MNSPIVKAKTLDGSDSLFPNGNSTLAEFRSHSQTIHLHETNRADIPLLIARQDFSGLSRKLPIITHEQTHWLDLISTVWGQNYLAELFDAYEAIYERPGSQPEYDWWKVIKLYDQDRRIMFPRYYKTVSPDPGRHNIRNPWTLDFSVGREFRADGRVDETQPVLFARFGRNPSRELIARQPLTIGSLLECTATHFEMWDEYLIMDQITDEGTKLVEKAIRKREREDALYDVNLIDYTCAAHVLSAISYTKEPILTYRLASSLAIICLNLTDKHFEMLKVPGRFDLIGKNLISAFRKAANRGFAFVCLASLAPAYTEGKNEDTWIEETLKAADLPSRAKITRDAVDRLDKLQSSLTTRFDLDRTRDYLLQIGRSILPIRSDLDHRGNPANLLSLGVPFPPMFDSDGEAFDMFAARLDRTLYDPNFMFDREADLDSFRRDFLTACRGV